MAGLRMPSAADAALPWWSALPFLALLLAIASLPLLAGHWWESNVNRAKVTAAIALPFAAWWLSTRGESGVHQLLASLEEYLAFIVLLGSLYVISGGIHVAGTLAGTPLVNTAILAIGAVLANLIGTTGASMVLIRPLLRANQERASCRHAVVFFIFVVSNTGGLLTPLGDPPLYLGFLHGVPFGWTLRLLPEWLLVNGLVLATFYVVDRRDVAREVRAGPAAALPREPLRIEGAFNAVLLLGVALVTVAHGAGWAAADGNWPYGLAELLLIGLALTAWITTSPACREANAFGFAPIVEVAVLFLGIFVTMTAPLLVLNAHGSKLGLTEPWHYFWGTGLVSSVLDNAPTYLSFAATLAGSLGIGVGAPGYLGQVIASAEGARLLAAISCGAVFMGAMSYIGNGPNFMVKTLAESAGVKMPSFFGYLRWSFLILTPLFAIVSLVFFV
jgi:Na+/H+ antiporter NhaD/arsenite permease-like protein